MALNKQVQIKIVGKRVKGTILNGVFLTEYLVISNAANQHYTMGDVETSIEELQELLDLMRSMDTAEILERS